MITELCIGLFDYNTFRTVQNILVKGLISHFELVSTSVLFITLTENICSCACSTVSVTVTGTQCCHTPASGATVLTWAVMRWAQVTDVFQIWLQYWNSGQLLKRNCYFYFIFQEMSCHVICRSLLTSRINYTDVWNTFSIRYIDFLTHKWNI